MEEAERALTTEIKEIAIDAVHNYIRDLFGEMAHIAIIAVLILLGILFLFVAVTNSNFLLGNPNRRDRSQLNELEYRKFRFQLRLLLGIGGFILIVYNIFGLTV